MQTSESVSTSTPRPGSSASTTTNTSEPRQNISRKRKVRPEMESIIKRNEELIALERKKIEILENDANVEDDDDLLFFKSLLPHIKSLPVIKNCVFGQKYRNLS
ncbi:BESS motif [Popillia japonica]|uniref:BESS motif n=1 Tax=Popillia japonica TaxID=7064 RepID=A0AAW1HUM8_POPJA